MDKIILTIEAESFQDRTKALPVPINAYGLCVDDNTDLLLVYEAHEKAA